MLRINGNLLNDENQTTRKSDQKIRVDSHDSRAAALSFSPIRAIRVIRGRELL
jgi:hypothetical protein